MRKETRIVALYERLSHDDANLGGVFFYPKPKEAVRGLCQRKGAFSDKTFFR